MKRRSFLKQAAAGVAAGAVAAPAIAQSMPTIQWRLASSFPKSLDTIYGGGDVIAKRVAALTDGKFKISLFGAGELVPAFGTVDAVQQGTVECTHTAGYYFVGKNKTFAFDTTLPFGLNQRMQNAFELFQLNGFAENARTQGGPVHLAIDDDARKRTFDGAHRGVGGLDRGGAYGHAERLS